MLLRTFTRDTKAVVEREQALLLIRAVVVLPSERPRRLSLIDMSASPSRRGLHMSLMADPKTDFLNRRVPLTDGLVRAVVSVAENVDDAMRIVCMETLVEIGTSNFFLPMCRLPGTDKCLCVYQEFLILSD